jgi:hypothetical protein
LSKPSKCPDSWVYPRYILNDILTLYLYPVRENISLEEYMNMKRIFQLFVLCTCMAILLTSCSTFERAIFQEAVSQTVEEPIPIVEEPMPVENETTAFQEAPWVLTSGDFTGSIGQRFTLTLPPGGVSHSLWGTVIYTDDSSIGTAAVHMGLITFEKGGTVTIEIREGIDTYLGTTRNGVTSTSYGSWDSSFVFISPQGTVIMQ